MKLLYLASDFDLSDKDPLLTSSKIVLRPISRYDQEKTRYTPVVALLIMFVFAGFSLTIPLHPTRSAVPNGCSTTVALSAGESAATCILQATKENISQPVEASSGASNVEAGPLARNYEVSPWFTNFRFAMTVLVNLLARQGLLASPF